MVSDSDLQNLLAHTKSLFAHIHHFDCTPAAFPGKSTAGAAITYSDLVERRSDFVRELRSSVCSWVYSKSKYSALLKEELEARGCDQANAATYILELARAKFRSGYPQGQFGELLLFNFLQHLFSAPPLLRKMPIVTNAAVERHGADAIHIGVEDGKTVLYLGEAKTYSSKYKFQTALDSAVASILKAHDELQTELDLYVFDDFIEEPLLDMAKAIRRNALSYEVRLVSVISYSETAAIAGMGEAEIKASIEKAVSGRLTSANRDLLNAAKPAVVARMHFIFLPFWNFDSLLEEFES